MFYGGPRFSLDLDFTVLGRDVQVLKDDAKRIKNHLNLLLKELDVKVDLRREKFFKSEGFYRYFLVFDTHKYLGKKIRVKNEFLVREKFFDPTEFILEIEYPFKTAVSIKVKKVNQLLCDKIASLAGGYHRGLLRWRDLFDIYWLKKKHGAEIEKRYFSNEFGSWIETETDIEKLASYLIETSFESLYEEYTSSLGGQIPESFKTRQIFSEILNVVSKTLEEALEVLKS